MNRKSYSPPSVVSRVCIAIVLVHLLVNLVHGAAHWELHIDLSAAEMLFVVVVILAGPLVFGFSHHFVAS